MTATDQMHDISQTSLLHLSLSFQAIYLIQEIVTLSFHYCNARVTFFGRKRIQSWVDGILHKDNRHSQVFEQGGIVKVMCTNHMKFLSQIKVCRCDDFTFLNANISAVDKYPMYNLQLYICVCIGFRALHPMHRPHAIGKLVAQTWDQEISEKCFANRHFVLVKEKINFE